MPCYIPNPMPAISTQEELASYLASELQRISVWTDEPSFVLGPTMNQRKEPPNIPREGSLAYANGTTWDPGKGAGMYSYIDGDWRRIAPCACGGAGSDFDNGVTNTNSSTDINITGGDSSAQIINLSEVDLSATLPDATTLDVGGVEAYLYNDGKYAFAVRNNDADMVAYLRPRQGAIALLSDNSSAAGEWRFIGSHEQFSKPVPQIVNDGEVRYFSSCALSDTEILQVYAKDVGSSRVDYKCVVLTRTAEAIAFGSTDTIASSVLDDVSSTDTTVAIKLTGSKAIVFYIDDEEPVGFNEQEAYYSIVTITAGVPSAATPVLWRAGSLTSDEGTKRMAGCELDTDKGLIVFQDNDEPSARAIRCQVVDTSSGVTFGSTVNLGIATSTSEHIAAAKISTTKAIVVWEVSGEVFGRVVTISGTTATAAGSGPENGGSFKIINSTPGTCQGADVCVLDTETDAETFLTITYTGSTAGDNFWQPIVAASNLDSSNDITTEEWSPPLGPLVYSSGGNDDIGNPRVQISALDTSSAIAVFPAQKGWMTGVPIAVRVTWDETQFHFSEPEIIGTGEILEIATQTTTFELRSFEGEPYRLAFFYRISDTDYRAMHIEVAL